MIQYGEGRGGEVLGSGWGGQGSVDSFPIPYDILPRSGSGLVLGGSYLSVHFNSFAKKSYNRCFS